MTAGSARSRILVTLVAGFLAIVGGLAVGSGTASAHNPVLTASVSCDGVLHWTATSWTTGPAGTNSDIAIYYLIDNEGPQVPVTHGAFTAENGYQFSGSFAWPDTTGRVVLYAEAIGVWGDGVVPTGAFWREWISFPSNCETTTTTEAATTTTEAATTTTEAATTTTSSGSGGGTTTTTAAATTTTAVATTTTAAATTTTSGSGGGGTTTTTSGSGGGTTTTNAGSGGPTTTTGSGLPNTGSSSSSLLLIGLGCCLVGSSIVMALRRQPV